MLQILIKVFKQPLYLAVTVLVSLIVLFSAILLPNLSLLINLYLSSSASVIELLEVTFSLLGSLKTNFTIVSASYTVVISVLFGINVSLVVYYVRNYKDGLEKSGITTSTFGILVGVFGIGCASCGSLILTSLLAALGLGTYLAFLPLGGQEFGFLGVILLLISTYLLLKKILKPNTCEVK